MDFDLLSQQLNPAQEQAVQDTEGAVLVLAGAGSGKTRVLTHRIVNIIKSGKAEGWQILAVTFTNKAASEMKERISSMLGADNTVWVATIHSFCTSVLRKYIKFLGFGSNFSIYSENDRDRVIKRILREKHLDNLDDDMGEIISKVKNEDIPIARFGEVFGKDESGEAFAEVFTAYEQAMRDNNALDFDDLLMKARELFLHYPEALEYYQNKFRYIHVDEFQDTNAVQMELVKMLAGKHGNIFVVGDDDQSIYGWRGAKIQNILEFDKAFPNAKIYKLEQNYRSTPEILAAANNVIKHNRYRHDKTLFTEHAPSIRVEYYQAYNDRQESDYVVDTIKNLIYFNNYSAKDFAILVRNNALTRGFEQRLNSSGIGYRVFGGFKFFDRKEVVDVLAYLRVMLNSRDNEAIERIINIPRRGIGDTTVEKLVDEAKLRGSDLFGLLSEISTNTIFNAGTTKKLEEFYALLSKLYSYRNLPLYQMVKSVVETVNFEAQYNDKSKEEDYNRWLNIQEFVNYVKEYSEKNPLADLVDFVSTCTLVSTGDVDQGAFVTVATIHAVKGLEFPVVFVCACEETIIPSAMALKESAQDGLEEERRLMYVALTRARDRLFVTSATQRFKYGRVEMSLPSRFVTEAKGGVQQRRIDSPTSFVENHSERIAPKKDAFVEQTLAKKVAPAVASAALKGITAGKKVKHPRYGEGVVLVVDGDAVSVLFKELGVKKFSISAAPLTLM